MQVFRLETGVIVATATENTDLCQTENVMHSAKETEHRNVGVPGGTMSTTLVSFYILSVSLMLTLDNLITYCICYSSL